MKIVFTASLLCFLFVTGCQKNDSSQGQAADPETETITERKCASNDILEEQLAADPTLRKRMNEIEDFIQRTIERSKTSRQAATFDSIPVVVHVVYKTAAQNISDAQVLSQIDVLNKDFNKMNTDISSVPNHFAGVVGNAEIKFKLDQIIRQSTTKSSFGTNDGVKRRSSGGSNPIDPTNKLNIWVCNLGQGLLGYAQFPGGNPATDGVVCLYSAFGSTGTLTPNYNKGRTATHEVGHYFDLRHIWGDATCGSDLVDDTPVHNTSNGGCPQPDHRSTCNGAPLEMWMNYMDYTYDACMYMFTAGQSARMQATLAPGSIRGSLVR